MEAFIPFIFVFVIMYVALILPQQRRAKADRELVASLTEGDEVVLNSGIHGFINTIDGEVVWLEVSAGVELKVSRAAIAHRIVVEDDADDDADDDDDDDDNEFGIPNDDTTDTIDADE